MSDRKEETNDFIQEIVSDLETRYTNDLRELESRLKDSIAETDRCLDVLSNRVGDLERNREVRVKVDVSQLDAKKSDLALAIGRCEACDYWAKSTLETEITLDRDQARGFCTKLFALFSISHGTVFLQTTSPSTPAGSPVVPGDFGCVLWREKEGR